MSDFTAATPRRVLVCYGLSCATRGSRQLHGALEERIAERDDVRVEAYYRFNGYSHGPNVVLDADHVWYEGVAPGDIDALVAHATTGEPAERPGPGRVPEIVRAVAFEALDRKYPADK